MREIESAMADYQALSDQAMKRAEDEFSGLERDMEAARQLIRDSVAKLSGSLTGLDSHSANQRQMLSSLIDEMLQMTGSASAQGDEQASLQRFFDQTNLLIDEFVRKVAELRDSSVGIAESFERTKGQVQSITGLLNNAETVTKKTDMLALNAAIEAARAGEAGRGFAVVADEVRKLAEKSAQSTKEISELIQSIQKEARRAVDNMEKSTSIVNEGLNLGQELNGALRKISNVVTEVYKFAQEIGAATNEQSHGSSQIARATTRLNEITHEINSAVEEQASGAQAVVKAMERMRELVQNSTSGSTELAASAEQMTKMSSDLLGSMDNFALRPGEGAPAHRGAARPAAAGGR